MKKFFKKGDTLVEILFAVAVFGLVAILTISTMNRGVQNAQSSLEQTTARTEIETQAEALRFINNAYAAQRNLGNTNEYYTNLWTRIKDLAKHSDPEKLSIADVTSCSSVYDESNADGVFSEENPAFIINTRLLYNQNIVKNNPENIVRAARESGTPQTNLFVEASIYPRLIYGQSDSNGSLVAAASGDSAENLTEDLYGTNYKALKSAEGIWVIAVPDDMADPTYYDFYIRSCWYAPGSDTSSTISSTIRLYDPDVSVTQSTKKQFNLIFQMAGTPTYSKTSKLDHVNFKIQQTRPNVGSQVFMGWHENGNLRDFYTQNTTQKVFTSNNRVERTSTYISIEPGDTILEPAYGYTYTVNYNCNYTATSCGAHENDTYVALGSHNYPVATNVPSRSDWIFRGWATSAGGSVVYAPGASIPMPNGGGTVNLYAVWGGYHYKLLYNRNSGSDAVTGMPSNVTFGVTEDTSKTVTVADVRGSIWRDNTSGQCYTFEGWATSASGSVAYVGGETITLTPSNEVVNLYAVWHPNSGTGRCFTYLVRLDWGADPSDLDSHLTATGYSEIYYGNKGDCTSGNLCLDLDDVSSYGPETISIITEPNKTYTYFVHNFSGGGSIGASPTTVTLSHGNGQVIRTYTAPSSQTADWYPFRITTNASGVATITNL